MPDYLLIADTEMYAGNFERPMCAFVTGRIGDCGVGKELAELVHTNDEDDLEEEAATGDPIGMSTELWDWCQDWISQMPDDHGTHRPVSISPTPGWFNDGLGNHHREGADPDMVKEKYNEAVNKNADRTRTAYADKEYAGKQADEFIARNLNNPSHTTAFQSVEIYLGQKPPEALLNEMIERIKFFCTEHKPGGAAAGRMGEFTPGPIPLTRVRFVERKVVTTDTPLLVVEA
ncbi:hypothetical protein N9917_00665 [Deltaproteobacteria bacterium]|nr:hypothetical protein [Deltaproteobacteria bacterium]